MIPIHPTACAPNRGDRVQFPQVSTTHAAPSPPVARPNMLASPDSTTRDVPSPPRSPVGAPIPRVVAVKQKMSFREFMAHVSTSCEGNATKDVRVQQLALHYIGKSREVWLKHTWLSPNDRNEIAYKIYLKTGKTVSGAQVASIFSEAKVTFQKRLAYCRHREMDPESTERHLKVWELYKPLKFFREASSAYEKSGGVEEGASSSGITPKPAEPEEPKEHIVSPPHPILPFLTHHLHMAFENHPTQSKVLKNAVLKLILALDERATDFETAQEMFEKIAE